jgi:hypothetical protein
MNHDLRQLHFDMEPETIRVYEELHLHETEYGISPDPEPPSEKDCRMQVYVHTLYMYI